MSPKPKRIAVTARTVDGAQLYFVDDERQAETVRGIVGSAAIDEQQLQALEALGFSFAIERPTDAAKSKRGKRGRGKGAKSKRRGKERVASRAERISEHLIQHVVAVRIITRTFPTSNVWVLHDGKEAALIDAGFGDDGTVGARLDYFQKELPELDFRYIAITHHHFDHSSGGRKLREGLRAEIAINPIDEELLHAPAGDNQDLPDEQEIEERARVWHEEAAKTPVDIPLSDGDELKVGNLSFSVIHNPGHTPGSTTFVYGKHAFVGDTLFPGGPGASRTNELLQQEIESIKTRLFTLPEDTAIWPGHGDGATIGSSKAEYEVFAAKEHDPDLHGDVSWLES